MTSADTPVPPGAGSELCCPPLLQGTLDEAGAADLAGVLKALADPARLRLVSVIAANGEMCACDLPAFVDRTQPTVSHHLSTLVKAGLLAREQRGKWAWFRLRHQRLQALCEALGVPGEQCAGEASVEPAPPVGAQAGTTSTSDPSSPN